MPLPKLNSSGVMPPYLPGSSPQVRADMAPYATTTVELVQIFGHTPERAAILRGLINYRSQLRNQGIDGTQWIAGSLLEDCEKQRSRPPADVDVVTFGYRPTNAQDDSSWQQFVHNNRTALFDRSAVKSTYACDAFYVDMHLHPEMLVSSSRYWFGLFSHQRVTDAWKGIVSLPLSDNDQAALSILSGGISNAP